MPTQVHLVAHIAHQREVTIDARERLLDALPATPSAIALATCHRVEIYEAAGDVVPRAGLRTLVDGDAARHLFRVASGLDSVVAGEPQILGQVRSALASRRTAHPLLHRAFEHAVHVGRAVRLRTGLGLVRRSIGSLAVDHVVRSITAPAAATVLVVGAGEMGKLAVRALSRRVARVIVANRDRSRAEALAALHDVEACALDELPRVLASADALVAAADTRGAHLTRALLAARAAARPLLVVDIAMPRSVAEDARELAGLDYRSVDDLIDDGVAVPDDDIAVAEELCARAAEDLMRAWDERAAVAVIEGVRSTADRRRRAQLERALRRLGHLSERDRRIVEALSIGVMNSLLHTPTVALRRSPTRADAARELFGVEGNS